MSQFLRSLIIAAALLFVVMPVKSKEIVRGSDKVTARLMTNFDEVNPRQPLQVLIKFSMKNDWHIFSQNPGDIGEPTKVVWKLPLGYEVVSERWSQDKKFVTDGIVQYGYDKTAYYEAEIRPAAEVFNVAKLEAEVSWLACREECVPEKRRFFIDLPVTGKDLRPSKAWDKAVQTAEHSFTKRVLYTDVNLYLVVFMAFFGGIILNFMPCIFPILTIKAISLAQSPYNRKKSRIEAGMYTLGVILSFLIIATVLMVLRLKGEEVGWGFQLQSPVFVSVMIIIFFLIFLMFLDVINIRNPLANKVGRISFRRQMLNSFVTGFFAVLIASPCTAPFMGIAIGYTLTAPLYVYYPVFLSLSLGYALPFALAGLFPKTIHRILPRPGKWMDILKKIFAIPVFLTVVWLLWVLYNQLNAGWEKEISALHWEEYNSLEVAELVKKGDPVFIDFTAKWCITCLVNKRVALQSHKFARQVKDRKIHLFRADWTNKDGNITAALERYGRNSIPLYVYYDGKSPNYVILPQLLTPSVLEDHLQ